MINNNHDRSACEIAVQDSNDQVVSVANSTTKHTEGDIDTVLATEDKDADHMVADSE